MPTQWMVPPVTTGVVSRTLEKRSCCELELDACVEHVLNRNEVRISVAFQSSHIYFGNSQSIIKEV